MRFPAPFAAPLIAAGLACAAGPLAHAETLRVAIDHSARLPVAGRAASVLVGNAKVADVTVVDTHTLFVTGKTAGSTDVTVVDPLGRTVYAAEISVSAGAGAPITVHRAGERSELNCSPRCVTTGDSKPPSLLDTLMTAASGAKPGASGAAGGAAPPALPGMGSMVGDAGAVATAVVPRPYPL